MQHSLASAVLTDLATSLRTIPLAWPANPTPEQARLRAWVDAGCPTEDPREPLNERLILRLQEDLTQARAERDAMLQVRGVRGNCDAHVQDVIEAASARVQELEAFLEESATGRRLACEQVLALEQRLTDSRASNEKMRADLILFEKRLREKDDVLRGWEMGAREAAEEQAHADKTISRLEAELKTAEKRATKAEDALADVDDDTDMKALQRELDELKAEKETDDEKQEKRDTELAQILERTSDPEDTLKEALHFVNGTQPKTPRVHLLDRCGEPARRCILAHEHVGDCLYGDEPYAPPATPTRLSSAEPPPWPSTWVPPGMRDTLRRDDVRNTPPARKRSRYSSAG